MNLQIGSSGEQVVELQNALNENGFKLVADGVFGTKTKNAVASFQVGNGLVNDGVVGPLTAAKLGLATVTVPSPISAPWDGSFVLGLDLSDYQRVMGPTEWAAEFANGVRWMYPKSNDGMSGPQSTLDTFKRDAAAAEIISSAGYCFSRYNTDPIAQAAALVKATGGVKVGELPHVLDIEWDNSAADKARYGDGKEMDAACEEHTFACLSEIERLTNVTPWIYTSSGFFNAQNSSRFSRFPVIIANYSAKTADGAIAVPKPWLREVARQYSGSLSVGRVSEIDGDRFLGTLDQLKAYVKQ